MSNSKNLQNLPLQYFEANLRIFAFKIALDLENAVPATQGNFPRTAAASWFTTQVHEDINSNKKRI